MYAVVGSHPPPPLNLNLVHKILNTEVSKPNLSLLLQHYGKDIFQDSFLNNTVKTKLIQKSLVLLQLPPLKKYLLSFCWKVKYFYDKIILKVPALTECCTGLHPVNSRAMQICSVRARKAEGLTLQLLLTALGNGAQALFSFLQIPLPLQI